MSSLNNDNSNKSNMNNSSNFEKDENISEVLKIESDNSKHAARNAAYVGLFATLVMVGAFIKIPIPIIPFTLQFLFVALAGLLLGAKLGGLSVFIYVALGLIGLPIFTAGGGPGYVFYPTFGYLIGFIVNAIVTGFISKKLKANTKNYFLSAFIGLLVLHSIGIPYYYIISKFVIENGLSFYQIFLFCFVYTVPVDILLSFVAARLALRLKGVLFKEQI